MNGEINEYWKVFHSLNCDSSFQESYQESNDQSSDKILSSSETLVWISTGGYGL